MNKQLLERLQDLSGVPLNEKINLSTHDVIIPKGEKLYHGTGESFDIRDIGTGGYDKVLWTTTNTRIAKYYIPVVGSYTAGIRLDKIKKEFINGEEPWYSIVKNQLGISDTIKNKLIKKGSEINDKKYELYSKTKEYEKLSNKIERELDVLYHKPKTKESKEKIKELELKQDSVMKNWEESVEEYKSMPFIKYDSFINQAIAFKMKKLFGYELNNNYGDKLYDKIMMNHDNELLSSDYQDVGKVVILIPKRDLKFYNYAYGRGEGDLMDIDYHKIDLFRKAEDEGYDGIIIHDFAQSHKWGNYGHIAYGLFKDTIKDCDIKSIQKQKHPLDENTIKRMQDLSGILIEQENYNKEIEQEVNKYSTSEEVLFDFAEEISLKKAIKLIKNSKYDIDSDSLVLYKKEELDKWE